MKQNAFLFIGLLIVCIIASFAYDSYMKSNRTGIHYLIDVNQVDDSVIYDNEKLKQICDTCLEKAKVTIVNKQVHEFQPHGLTMLYLLSESHFSIHTWPEKGKLRIDLFSCSTPEKCELGTQYLREEAFQNCEVHVTKMYR